MKLYMLETRRGTEDGFTVKRFMRGQTYEIAPDLARAFLAAGWAMKWPQERTQKHYANPLDKRKNHG